MSAPGFWDNQEHATSVSAAHSTASRRLESYRSLERDVDDLETLEEMAADDESIAVELEEQPAGPTLRTGQRCCCAWRCAGPSGAE